MANWVTISSLATAGGTLVLALATFSSVRASNRSAKISERALLGANRPLLINSHIYDPAEKLRFQDTSYVKLAGGHAYAAVSKEAIYFAISLRNIGQGPAVLDHWSFATEDTSVDDPGKRNSYRRQNRDIYIPAGDIGYWQGAIRDLKDPQFAKAADAITNGQSIMIRLQYADQEGGQRTISLFGLTHNEKNDWLAAVGRHWRLDGPNPRQ